LTSIEHRVRRQETPERVNGDADAAYTERVYRLNDPHKRELRRERAVIFTCERTILAEAPRLAIKLLGLHRTTGDIDLLRAALLMLQRVEDAKRRLRRRLRPVPYDAPTRASCAIAEHRRLPAGLAVQLRSP
jgi:hypothetical protein